MILQCKTAVSPRKLIVQHPHIHKLMQCFLHFSAGGGVKIICPPPSHLSSHFSRIYLPVSSLLCGKCLLIIFQRSFGRFFFLGLWKKKVVHPPVFKCHSSLVSCHSRSENHCTHNPSHYLKKNKLLMSKLSFVDGLPCVTLRAVSFHFSLFCPVFAFFAGIPACSHIAKTSTLGFDWRLEIVR